MNLAAFILPSMTKAASKGMVMTALEAATGAMAGGMLGVMTARKGRSGDPVGPSDISGAVYGGVMGALAGGGAGSLIRATAQQRGVAKNSRLRSLAEDIADLDNLALQNSARTSRFAAQQHADQVFKDITGEAYQSLREQTYRHNLTYQKHMGDLKVNLRAAQLQNDPVETARLMREKAVAEAQHKRFKEDVLEPFAELEKARTRYLDLVKNDNELRSKGIEEARAMTADNLERLRERLVSQSRADTQNRFFGIKL